MNKQKQIINSHIRPYVKLYLLEGHTIANTAEKFGVIYDVIKKYYNGKTFTLREKDGIKYRRCTNCMIYRTYNNFHSNGNTKHSQCINCRNQLGKNHYIINKVKYGEKFRKKINDKFKRNYDKGIFNRKRCVKRRIKNIINNNFRKLGQKKKGE